MSHNRGNGLLLGGLGFAAGLLGGVLLARKLAVPRQMPYLATIQQTLAPTLGEVETAMLAGRMQAQFRKLYATRPRFPNSALRGHLEQNVLPALAVCQILRAEGYSEADALEMVEGLFESVYGRFGKAMQAMTHLPPSFSFFRRVTRLILQQGFPSTGWRIEMVEDDDQTFAFNMHSCFYLDVLTAYGAPELTPLFCKTDDWLAEALPAEIHWGRTKTLGRGDDCCDFRWTVAGAG
jgi:hypothetical protein